MKRYIKLDGIDKQFEISKATAVKVNSFLMRLDLLPDGSLRLVYNSKLIPDFTKIEGLTIIRED